MKVFWSWQSDHPGKISRHFVREALEQAISELKQDPEIEEAARDAELDHDRKGVPGSPDLANVILEKIRNSDVFVADVTPVGVVPGSKKALLNSNVAIELGFALATVTDRALLMVLNEAFGKRDDLPFDLQHKAGPITYRLPEGAEKEAIRLEKIKLIGTFKTALREMISIPRIPPQAFGEAIPSIENPGRFFQSGEILAQRRDVGFRCSNEGLLFVRVFPTSPQTPLARFEVMEAVQSGNLAVLNDRATGWSKEHNKYGVIVFDGDSESGEIRSAVQLFKSKEIWGFDAEMLVRQQEKRGIPTGWHEYMLALGLQKYVQFARRSLGLAPPMIAEIGITNVNGYILHMDRHRYWDASWGPIHENNIVRRYKLVTCEPDELDKVLLDMFEQVFDAAGTKRPVKYNGFPGAEHGSLPARR